MIAWVHGGGAPWLLGGLLLGGGAGAGGFSDG